MNNDEKKLVERLGEFITVENIYDSNIKNVLEGEVSYNNRKIKAYIIGDNLHIEKKKFEGKIVGLIELKENDEERIVVVEKENNYLNSYSQITGVFRDVEELKQAKFKCLYETSAGVVIYMVKNGEPYYLVTYSKKNFSGFPKGHVEYGETEETAAKREALEEVGVNVELKPNFKSSISYTVFDTPIQKEVIFFLGEIKENTKINIDINEINKYEIVNYEQAKFILNDELMNVLTEAKKYIESI